MPTITKQVAASTDDAIYRIEPSTAFNLSSSQYVGSLSVTYFKYGIGALITELPMSRGDDVTAAHIEAYGAGGVDGAKTKISAELTANPATFSTKADFETRITNRTLAAIFWDDIIFTPDTWNVSPDISHIIQEVINLPNWNGSIALFWDDWDGRSANGKYCLPANYEYGPAFALKLVVTYNELLNQPTMLRPANSNKPTPASGDYPSRASENRPTRAY